VGQQLVLEGQQPSQQQQDKVQAVQQGRAAAWVLR
jgi:hypothetical protein